MTMDEATIRHINLIDVLVDDHPEVRQHLTLPQPDLGFGSQRGWRAAERRHPTGRERMGQSTSQTLQDPILLLPWLCFRGGGKGGALTSHGWELAGSRAAGERRGGLVRAACPPAHPHTDTATTTPSSAGLGRFVGEVQSRRPG
jgi:hypothetical protein